MAHGLLLLLVGEENKNKKKYENLEKEYIFEVLFGLKTDTYDILGIVNDVEIKKTPENLEQQIQKLLPSFIGKQQQPYPPYSSMPVNGKPLYYWAREKKLSEITIPSREIEIFDVKLLDSRIISIKKLKEEIVNKISKVSGDFRQKSILDQWGKVFEINKSVDLSIIRFQISATTGTYVRSVANKIGEEIGTGAIAFDILRTKIGNHKLEDTQQLN